MNAISGLPDWPHHITAKKPHKTAASPCRFSWCTTIAANQW